MTRTLGLCTRVLIGLEQCLTLLHRLCLSCSVVSPKPDQLDGAGSAFRWQIGSALVLEQGLSQRAVAEQMGVTVSCVSQWVARARREDPEAKPPKPKRGAAARGQMAGHLRPLSVQRRLQAAIDKVQNEGWQQAEAARYCGVNPATVNRKLKEARKTQAEQAERVAAAQAERIGAPSSPLDDQSRRVPPIGEFVRKYFDGLHCWDCGVRHEIPGFHDEIMTRMADPREKRLLVNIPPGHSKTTNGTVFSTVHEIVRDPNSQTAIMSAGEDLAKDIVGQIARFLSDPEIYEGSTANLIDDFGPFNDGDSTWTQKALVVAGRQSMERDPTVRGFGIDSKIYGRRLHRIICDDIADEDNQSNPDNVAKMFRKVTSTLDSRVGKNGKLMIVGTRVAPADIYSMLLKLDDYTVLRHPCILDYAEELTLWPEHISFADASKIKNGRMTAEMFELIYQNSDLMTEGASFTREQLDDCHDEDRVLGQLPKGVAVTLFIGVDPAGSGKQAGFTAMVLLGVDRDGKRYLIDVVNTKQMKAPQMQSQIFDWVQRYRPRAVRFENVALQMQIFDTKEYRDFLNAHGTRMEWHSTNSKGGPGGKWDSYWGVDAMSTSFHNRMVSIPWGDRETRRRVGELEEQLMRFPMEGAPTDLCMAYWIANTGCQLLVDRQHRAMPRYGTSRDRRHQPSERLLAKRRIINLADGTERAPTARDMRRGPSEVGPIRLANMPGDARELEAAGRG